MTTIRRTNTVLYCRHFDSCIDFYGRQLGLPVVFRTDWLVEFEVNAGSCLSVADVSRTRQPPTRGVTITLEVEDAEALHARWDVAGLPVTELRAQPWDARGFFVFDPDDNRLEFWSRPVV